MMNEEIYKGLVLYVDGGSRPNPGCAGWGAHGYLYTTESSKTGPGISHHKLTNKGYIPSNISDFTNDEQVVQPLTYYDFVGSILNGTNNIGELTALLASLEFFINEDVKDIQIFTDSEYVRKGIAYGLSNWIKNDWRKFDNNPVANKGLWLKVNDLLTIYKNNNKKVSIDWVKGHADNFGNVIADKLATIGVIHSIDNIYINDFNTSPAKGYWKSEITINPLLGHKKLFFNTHNDYNKAGYYFTADNDGDEKIIGKKTPDTTYALVKLISPELVIEITKSAQYRVADNSNLIAMLRLDKLYHSDVYPYINRYGINSLIADNKLFGNLNFADDKPITVIQNPPGLCIRAIEYSATLEELLELFITNSVNETKANLQIHDITDYFYQLSNDKKPLNKLKAEFVVGYKNIEVEIPLKHNEQLLTRKVPLILGNDLLPRNNLKRIEADHPTIYLMTWQESHTMYRYVCVIKTDHGIGIWSSYCVNQLFVK